MSVDVSKIKVGDELTVRLRVADEEGCGWFYLLNSAEERVRVHSLHFVSHTPRPLKAGDRVRSAGSATVGELLAIHKERAWVIFDCWSTPDSCRLSDLERAE